MNMFGSNPKRFKFIFIALFVVTVVFSWIIRITAGLGWSFIFYGILMILITFAHIAVHLRAISKIPLGEPWLLVLSNLFFFMSLAFQSDGGEIGFFHIMGIEQSYGIGYGTNMIGHLMNSSVTLSILAYILLFITWWGILLYGEKKHIVAITIVLTLVIYLAGYYFIYRGPQLETKVDYPDTVRVGEKFDVSLSLNASIVYSISVKEIDLKPAFGNQDFILQGASMLKTNPFMRSLELPQMQRAYSYNRDINPGGTQVVVFHFQATKAGNFYGSINVHTNDGPSYVSDIAITIMP